MTDDVSKFIKKDVRYTENYTKNQRKTMPFMEICNMLIVLQVTGLVSC